MKKLSWLVLAMASLASSMSSADTLTGSVSAWQVTYQLGHIDSLASPPTYDGTALLISNIPVTCTSNKLYFDYATADDMKAFYNFYLLAKTTGANVSLLYAVSGSRCNLAAFSLVPN